MRSSHAARVFTAGCFNRLHRAHILMLEAARALGTQLIVVLANDAHNRKSNAVSAPIRARRLRKLNIADRIIIGSSDGFAQTLRRIHPDIVALGYDQKLPDQETQDVVRMMGVKVVTLPWFYGKEETIEPDS
ncbi:MAG: adenylyltransferase/cytidyltransferase family protein [Elusimicrobiota bacterium]